MKTSAVQVAIIPPRGKATIFACVCGTVTTCNDGREESACPRCGRQMKYLAEVLAVEKPMPRRLRLVGERGGKW